jgi:hypothetical protein
MHKISYSGDGIQTEFAFDFPFFQTADIRAAIDGALLPAEKYAAIPNEAMTGGFVIFADPPAAGAAIDIFRKISLQRFIDYQPAAKIDPQHLNDDFNFLLEAFRDLAAVDADMAEWQNIHDNILNLITATRAMIEDKLGGGAALGLYNNLLSVLSGALPLLINDYGSIAEPAPNETKDDYGEI